MVERVRECMETNGLGEHVIEGWIFGNLRTDVSAKDLETHLLHNCDHKKLEACANDIAARVNFHDLIQIYQGYRQNWYLYCDKIYNHNQRYAELYNKLGVLTIQMKILGIAINVAKNKPTRTNPWHALLLKLIPLHIFSVNRYKRYRGQFEIKIDECIRRIISYAPVKDQNLIQQIRNINLRPLNFEFPYNEWLHARDMLFRLHRYYSGTENMDINAMTYRRNHCDAFQHYIETIDEMIRRVFTRTEL